MSETKQKLRCGAELRGHILLLGAMLVPLGVSRTDAQSDNGTRRDPQLKASGKGEHADSEATPCDVYRSYLKAVKTNDSTKAKQCWCMRGKDSAGALDVIAGLFAASHRFNAAMKEFGEDGRHFIREDCTDEAIDATLARLETAKVKVVGETATLTIQWEKDDGYPNPVFGYRKAPVVFRKTAEGWKIDANAECDIDKPEDFFDESGWGSSFRTQMEMMNDVSTGVEAGTLKSTRDVIRIMEKHIGNLDGRTPLTKPVLYEEDSPERYLRIRKGDPNSLSVGPYRLPHRKDVRSPTRVDGSVQRVLEELYHHRKMIIETANKKGYEVVYGYDDKKALEIVARQLGMTVGREERQIFALVLGVAQGGHHLKKVKRRETPDWQWTYSDGGKRTFHGVTMDELAQFLEDRTGQPVVNKTGLAGYYHLELSDDAERAPQKGQSKTLDSSGLQIHWGKTKTEILVVKDR